MRALDVLAETAAGRERAVPYMTRMTRGERIAFVQRMLTGTSVARLTRLTWEQRLAYVGQLVFPDSEARQIHARVRIDRPARESCPP